MDQERKKTKMVSIISTLSQKRRQKAEKDLSERHFHLKQAQEKANLFDKLIFQAILEQAEGLSLAFSKPFTYQSENKEVVRLGAETHQALEKAAILRPTRLGPLTLIS